MTKLSLEDFLRKIPKAELHYHLLGGVSIQTMLKLAKKYKLDLTLKEAKTYYRGFAHENEEMKGGIAALNFLYPLLKELEDYEQIAYEVLEEAKNSGIRYIEFFWNPTDSELPYKDVTLSLAKVFKQAEEQWNISAFLIPSINREKSPEEAVKMVKMMIDFPHYRVLGLGIDYRENNAPIENFWKAYKLAKENGFHLTGHCSEFGLHWRNVETGLQLLNLQRIDHGYSVIDNEQLSEKCAYDGVPFTVVPSNTFFLKKWPDKKEWQKKHPIRKMAQIGLKIIPSTDDWHMHNTNSVKCYETMIKDFGFDLNGIRQCILNGIDAAWQDERIKQKWRFSWIKEFDNLRLQLEEEPFIDPELHVNYGVQSFE